MINRIGKRLGTAQDGPITNARSRPSPFDDSKLMLHLECVMPTAKNLDTEHLANQIVSMCDLQFLQFGVAEMKGRVVGHMRQDFNGLGCEFSLGPIRFAAESVAPDAGSHFLDLIGQTRRHFSP